MAGFAGLALLEWAEDPEARLVGGNLPIDASATNPREIGANNSPALARNPADPDDLAVVNRVDSPALSCALHVSNDGGRRWRPVAIPFPEGEELPPRCFAPDVAFDREGTLYVAFVTLRGAGNVPSALWLTESADGGRTLAVPRRVWGPLTFGPRIVADPDRAGRISLVWLQAGDVSQLGFATTNNPVLAARSDDGGRTWAGPFRASAPDHARAVAPAVAPGPDGRLYVSYLDLGEDVLDYAGAHEGRAGEPYHRTWTLVLAHSDDGGSTWDQTVVDDGVVPTARIVVLFPPTASLAVDRERGRVFLAMADGREGDSDVWLWSSRDGTSFGPPVRVNDTPVEDRTSQYLPALGVAPDGRLDVVYYDRRRDQADTMNEVSFQSSGDGGQTFEPSLRLSDRPFDSRIGFGSERGLPDLGSRLAVLSSRQRALAMWADTRAGTVASGKQDVTQAVVSFDAARGAGRVAGAVLASAGLVLVLGWVAWSAWRRFGPRTASYGK